MQRENGRKRVCDFGCGIASEVCEKFHKPPQNHFNSLQIFSERVGTFWLSPVRSKTKNSSPPQFLQRSRRRRFGRGGRTLSFPSSIFHPRESLRASKCEGRSTRA